MKRILKYYTPKYVVDYFGEFDYDPATVKHKANEFGISNFDTIDTDGLKSDWTQYKRIWCNPPFTKKYDFIKKSVESYKSAHNDIYILIPIGSLTTKKFSETGFTGKIYIPNRRINFEHVNGIGKSPSIGSIIIKPESVDSIEYIDIKNGDNRLANRGGTTMTPTEQDNDCQDQHPKMPW